MRTYTANTMKKNCASYRAKNPKKESRDYIPWLDYVFQCTNTQAPTLNFILFI